MADGRRNWQRWLDQVVESLGSMPLYDPDFVWDPASYIQARRSDLRATIAIKPQTSPGARPHGRRDLASEDGPTAA